MLGPNAAVFGREHELDVVADFIGCARGSATGDPSALVLEGPAGIGKTTIWAEAVARARRDGVVTRICRCNAAEVGWAFSGLGDLLEGISGAVLDELPSVQREALSAALLLGSTTVASPGDRVVAVAVRGVLRALARAAPLLLAIDDLQWLDSSSRTVLTYALRRLDRDDVLVLASRRTHDGLDVETNTAGPTSEACLGLQGAVLSIGPVSVGSLQQIVHSRLSLRLSRPTLTRLHDATGGNPMASLEMGRALQRRGEPQLSFADPLPVPSDVRLLVADRLQPLSDAARDLVVVCAALAQPTIDVLVTALADPARAAPSVDEVVALGVMEIDGRRLRFTHPLVASVAYSDLSDEARSELHRRLADVPAGPEERARHLALGTCGRVAEVGDALEAAARHARHRGSREGAAEFAELSIERTPLAHTVEIHRRRVIAAEYLFHLGYPDRARSIVLANHDDASPGPQRVVGLLLLATIDYWTSGSAAAEQWLALAMNEAGADRVLAARCHAALADLAAYDAPRLIGHARAAVELMGDADDAPPDVLASALKNVAYHQLRLGEGLALELLERAALAEARSDPVPVIERVAMCMGMLLRFAGQFDEARRLLLQVRQSADDEGDDSALPNILGHLALLECWCGDYPLALHYAHDGNELAARTGVGSPSLTAAEALAEAHRGNIDQARDVARAAVASDEAHGEAADIACDLRSLGFVELAAGAFETAAQHFLRAMALAAQLGVDEPAILRIHADAVEALVGLDRLDEAERLTTQLETTAGADPAWASAMAHRCRGLLHLARNDLPAAANALAAALDDHGALGMPFEAARTRLLLGRVLRRLRRRNDARDMLLNAAAAFTELGTPRYADQAQIELARLGGRVAAPLTLTATELQVAELVGAGRTNQETAETLIISVRTVESHLGRIYRKLGLRSRSELAASLSESVAGDGSNTGDHDAAAFRHPQVVRE